MAHIEYMQRMSSKRTVDIFIVLNFVLGTITACAPWIAVTLFDTKIQNALSQFQPILGYAFAGVISVGTIRFFIQLLFLRTNTSDFSPIELMMPWGLGNLWDNPGDYFPPKWADLYRPWRIVATVFTPIITVAIISFSIFAMVTA